MRSFFEQNKSILKTAFWVLISVGGFYAVQAFAVIRPPVVVAPVGPGGIQVPPAVVTRPPAVKPAVAPAVKPAVAPVVKPVVQPLHPLVPPSVIPAPAGPGGIHVSPVTPVFPVVKPAAPVPPSSNQATFGDLAIGVTGSFSGMGSLMIATAYLAGIGFSIAAIFKFKQHRDNPTQIPVGTPLALFIIGIILIFFPGIVKPTGSTIFGGNAISGGFSGNTNGLPQ